MEAKTTGEVSKRLPFRCFVLFMGGKTGGLDGGTLMIGGDVACETQDPTCINNRPPTPPQINQTLTHQQIVNLMAVDAQRLQDLMSYFSTLWSAPYQARESHCLLSLSIGCSVGPIRLFWSICIWLRGGVCFYPPFFLPWPYIHKKNPH